MDAKKLDLKIGDEISPAYKVSVIESDVNVAPAPSQSVEEGAMIPGSGSSFDAVPDGIESPNNEGATGGAEEGNGDPNSVDATGSAEGESGSEVRAMEKIKIELSPGNIPAAAYCVNHLASSPNPTEVAEGKEVSGSMGENGIGNSNVDGNGIKKPSVPSNNAATISDSNKDENSD